MSDHSQKDATTPRTALTPGGISARTALEIPPTPESNAKSPGGSALMPGGETPTTKTAAGSPMLTRTGFSPQPRTPVEFSPKSSSSEKSTKTAREPRIDESTIGAMLSGSVFGRSREALLAAPPPPSRLDENTVEVQPESAGAPSPLLKTDKAPATPSLATALTGTPKSGKKRPYGGISSKTTPQGKTATNTAITPGGLSCRTARTLRTPLTGTPLGGRTPGKLGGLSTTKAKVISQKTPQSTPIQMAVPNNTPKTPLKTTGVQTAITPGGLSCKTAKTLRTVSQTTPLKLGDKTINTARRSLFPMLKIEEPKSTGAQSTKSVKTATSRGSVQKSTKSSLKKINTTTTPDAVNPKRSASAYSTPHSRRSIVSGGSVQTMRSFQPPGTPHTCHEIEPHALAEAKSEQQKVVLTTSTADGQFSVVIRLKTKVVGGETQPQAMITRKVTVNGVERYSG